MGACQQACQQHELDSSTNENFDVSKSRIKLCYFNAKGIMELTRCIFAVGMVDYEDFRYDMPMNTNEKYQADKASGQFETTGGIPYLEIDGARIGGFFSIYRAAASQAGLMGASVVEAGQIDMLLEKTRDIRNDYLEAKKDTEKKSKWYSEELPNALKILEKQVPSSSPGPFLVGQRISVADLFLWRLLKDDVLDNAVAAEAAYQDAPLKVKAAVDATSANAELQAWIARRPKTD